jgi:hypothetical protein
VAFERATDAASAASDASQRLADGRSASASAFTPENPYERARVIGRSAKKKARCQALYGLVMSYNRGLDGDKDGIAREKA